MKKLYFLFFLTIGFLANAQIINFPNVNFKFKLMAWGNVRDANGGPFVLDANGNGEIEVDEALNVYEMRISGASGGNIISDATGIEYFLNVFKIDISHNSLTSLDVSSLINLKELNCTSNQISNINVSGLVNLESLMCGYNQLASISLAGLTNLNYFSCSPNSILDLNINNLPNLQEIYCGGFGYNILNGYQKLTLSNLPSLITLNCSTGGLTRGLSELNMSGVDNLQNINARLTALATIDVSMLPNLQSLDVINSYNLVSIFAKNGSNETISFGSNLFTDNLKYFCADEFQLTAIQNSIASKPYMTNCHVNTYCSFVPGGNYFIVKGQSKIDLDNNGCTLSDISMSLLKYRLDYGSSIEYFISDTNGNYTIPLLSGTYTITPINENPYYYSISPPNIVVSFPTQISPVNQDFCVTIIPHHDVEVFLIPSVPARPGFDAKYKLVYRNKGNQVENGSVSLTFDDTRLDYVSATPVYNSTATNSFSWDYSNLQPFETREIEITFNVNSPMETPAVNNGDVLNYIATITTTNTDETPADNTFTLDQTVVGSYDPNDKTCLQGETIEPSMVGEYVHYLIRFENTGTYFAENIVVKDMIDTSKFDIATLVPLKSSHDFFTRISGNKVEFIFENINLDFDDATNDGYVLFKIKTLPTLTIGDTFSNQVNIYFDYNFPIVTNNYTTTVQLLNNQSFEFSSYFTLYPNPVKDVLNIQSKQDLIVNSMEIYNQLGQIVMAVANTSNRVDISNLASGIYFVKVNTDKGTANTKFIKE